MNRKKSALWICFVSLLGSQHLSLSCFGQVTLRVSGNELGAQHDRDSTDAAISGDGRFVAFVSSQMLTSSANIDHVYVRDLVTGQLERISQGNTDSRNPQLSHAGRYVCFETYQPIDSSDNNSNLDVYIYDRDEDTYELVSATNGGVAGNGHSTRPDMTPCGRWVVFGSLATNLVGQDNNGSPDIFWRDRELGITRRFSKSTSGVEGDGSSYHPSVSDDGQRIVYFSYASNLVANDTNGKSDIFLRDRSTGATTRVSVDSAGYEVLNSSSNPWISGDGNIVAFDSYSDLFVPGDNNRNSDIFCKDLTTGAYDVVTVSNYGLFADTSTHAIEDVSCDGRFVLFLSRAENLVLGDVNGFREDVFLRDRLLGLTEVLSVSTFGQRGLQESQSASMTDDAQTIALESDAENLIADDTNGRADIFVRGPEMSMTVQPRELASGDLFQMATWGGLGLGFVSLVEFDGVPCFCRIDRTSGQEQVGWAQSYLMPSDPSLIGSTATFQAFDYGSFTNRPQASNRVTVRFQ